MGPVSLKVYELIIDFFAEILFTVIMDVMINQVAKFAHVTTAQLS